MKRWFRFSSVLASMVLTSTNLLKKGMETMDAYTQEINYLNAPFSVSNPEPEKLKSREEKAKIKISSVSGGAAVPDIYIPVYVILEEPGETVISYTVKSGG